MKYNGALLSPQDNRDWRMYRCMDMPAGASCLPKEYMVPYLPEHKNQGNVNSCTAFAMAGIFECVWHKLTGQTVDFSTAYLYGNRMETTYTGEGCIMRDVVKTAHKHGDVTAGLLSGNFEVPEAVDVFIKAYPGLSDLAKKLVQGYVRIYNEDEAKAFLVRYGVPLFVCAQTRHVYPLSKSTALHAMMAVGYMDGYIKCRNSWGKYNCPGPELSFSNLREIWGIIPMEDVKFTDVNDTDWYAEAVKNQALKGVLKGYPDGTFRPNEPITRGEAAVILERLDKLER